jgi:hypothetical protein
VMFTYEVQNLNVAGNLIEFQLMTMSVSGSLCHGRHFVFSKGTHIQEGAVNATFFRCLRVKPACVEWAVAS